VEQEPFNDRDTLEIPQADPSSDSRMPRPRSTEVQVEIAGKSDRGLVRPNNEDHYLVAHIERSLETIMTNLPEGVLPRRFDETAYGMLVADGMGGHAAGEVASSMALITLMEILANTPDWILRVNQRSDADALLRRMVDRFRQVDAALKDETRNDPRLVGMGTTLTVAASIGADLFVAHVGDSRAYLMRGDDLHQLTRDDTMAQALIDAGIAQPKDRATHAMRHVLTAALGATEEQLEPEVHRLRLADGDQVMLCTDGLTEMVEDETIAQTLRAAKSADEACRTLVDLALQNGGKDNVTVVIARYRFP
jgi:PPM family protein phosphatase